MSNALHQAHLLFAMFEASRLQGECVTVSQDKKEKIRDYSHMTLNLPELQ